MKTIMWVKIKMSEKVLSNIKKCDISYSLIGANLYSANEIFNFHHRSTPIISCVTIILEGVTFVEESRLRKK